MRFVLMIVLTGCSPSLAGPSDDAEAALALALATPKKEPKKSAVETRFEDEAKAREAAIRLGKPLVIRYGDVDCSAVCSEIDAVVCHLPSAKKSAFRVMVHRGGIDPTWWYAEWDEMPPVDEVKRKIETLRGVTRNGKKPIDWDF